MPLKKRFIKKAIKRPGALSRQLDIPIKDKIPVRLLDKIIAAKAGETIRNPTKKGKRVIKVTRKLEQRAILARTLKRISVPKKFPSGKPISKKLRATLRKEIKKVRKR